MDITKLEKWVEEVANLTQPKKVVWCNGSDEEHQAVITQMQASGELHSLPADKYDNCYLYRSHPDDVARTEQQTYICTQKKSDAGVNNNWLHPAKAQQKIDTLFAGCMRDRTMYVIPYCMGTLNSPHAGLGIEITDSKYVVISMYTMTRMGDKALTKIKQSKTEVVRGLHSVADLNPKKRYIMHFPEELLIKSIGSGYGGNALLGKKCHALRIASWQAKQQGWLAEHMLIAGIEHAGKTHYIAAAFPSACGKTNLAMLIPPKRYRDKYKIWTVGDDIAWLRLGSDGRLYASNPEAGFFGVVPGTNEKTNPTAYKMLNRDTIFTNVALTKDGDAWWEGKQHGKPHIDWKGNLYNGKGKAAHPNSRFTVSAKQCPYYSPEAENPNGVPISAVIFGGRRSVLNPLVVEAFDWTHGVYMGATLSSEATAAIVDDVGSVRRDPMAMLPFCGYNMGEYWSHWLAFQKKSQNLPRIFQVNWFRKNKTGNFLWDGFSENLRVLQWIIARCENKIDAQKTPIGYLPKEGAIDYDGLDISDTDKQELFAVDSSDWLQELNDIDAHFARFGEHVPAEFRTLQQQIKNDFGTA